MALFNPGDDVFEQLINEMPVGLLLVDQQGNIVFINGKLQALLGYSQEEIFGKTVNILLPERYRGEHGEMLANYLKAPTSRAMDQGRVLLAENKKGHEIQIKIGLTPVSFGGEAYVLASMIEVSNEIIKIAANNDPLTGLPNRNFFYELSENIRSEAIRNGVRLSLLFIDLDDFKAVNDQYGHDIGDLVLCQVAECINHSVRKNDIIGRLGGDEFVLCLYGVANDQALNGIAKGLIDKISAIDMVQGHVINISASIGVACTNDPGNIVLTDMIKLADKLMYQAKDKGKGKVIWIAC
ncbi:sensor domain-containing diguanylate cyclase [Thalassomonas actiniarum]|uniref:GGDEF domain-containing protein n=1 Tax=Thalassomonas actiniarum TaxID=485447 RepID=A0AAF0BWH1_9GAMM|nr:sensor domain-containing diguanylate cyclase [Thalassomonas actiniarum]WDD96636.1 GGDEF domain-containing protein [Thalassomonas actiniarum]